MINTGKYFEGIVELLNNYRSAVQTFSSLGLLNINKRSEHFMKRILNLTYGYELENLNKGRSNYPGIDLGDADEGIAFQISATKKSDKIEDTLATCLTYEHYKTFKKIKVFILTKKQTSYTLKTNTDPFFTFSAEKDIMDIDDLLKEIEHLDPVRMKALYDYLATEIPTVLEAIKSDKDDGVKPLLNVETGMQESGMTRYSLWRSKVILKTENVPVPDIYTRLKELLATPARKNMYLPIFSDTLRKSHSNKQMLYLNRLRATHASNYFYGDAMLLEPSSITIEKSNYTDDNILMNLKNEMESLIVGILLFDKMAKGNYEIQITVELKSNTTSYFFPTDSLVHDRLLNSFILDNPFEITEIITNSHTSTIADLLQKIMYAFVSSESSVLNNDPFLIIKRETTEFVINNIKKELSFMV